ncbi:flavodoxin domain-containing protein [Streptomyces sp. NPDC008317]|uniref:flavodoxin domain-containing protein n=1 Tax=Streptomyces sp. NPDC008317 TaxID=3364827 RepID=UPI0036E238A5
MKTIRVLVAYGTRNGSTAEIAEWIGEALRERGIAADVRAAGGVKDVGAYDAVILGAGVYAGRWQRDAVRLARRQRARLAHRPVWLFSSGPLDSSAAAGDLPATPAVTRLADRIDARAHVTFGGRLTDGARGYVARQILQQGRGGDFRDPERIRAWARSVAEELREGAGTVVI